MTTRRKLGYALLALGLVLIVSGVFYILNQVGYAENGEFAKRRSYNQAKVAVHNSYPIGFAIAMLGLALAMGSARLRATSDSSDE